jgi:hypothetical protein
VAYDDEKESGCDFLKYFEGRVKLIMRGCFICFRGYPSFRSCLPTELSPPCESRNLLLLRDDCQQFAERDGIKNPRGGKIGCRFELLLERLAFCSKLSI